MCAGFGAGQGGGGIVRFHQGADEPGAPTARKRRRVPRPPRRDQSVVRRWDGAAKIEHDHDGDCRTASYLADDHRWPGVPAIDEGSSLETTPGHAGGPVLAEPCPSRCQWGSCDGQDKQGKADSGQATPQHRDRGTRKEQVKVTVPSQPVMVIDGSPDADSRGTSIEPQMSLFGKPNARRGERIRSSRLSPDQLTSCIPRPFGGTAAVWSSGAGSMPSRGACCYRE